MEILDNVSRLLGDDLKRTIAPGAKLRVAASCFSIWSGQDPAIVLRFFRRFRSNRGGCDGGDLIKEVAKREPLRAVFRDSSFANDSAKINVGQILALLSPTTEVKAL